MALPAGLAIFVCSAGHGLYYAHKSFQRDCILRSEVMTMRTSIRSSVLMGVGGDPIRGRYG